MHVRSFRVALSAGTVALLLTLLNVLAAFAGDGVPPIPK
jgi:hypothetical protein